MVEFFRQRLVAKLSLMMVLAVGLALVASTYVNTRYQDQQVRKLHENVAESMAEGLAAGVEMSMLAGKGHAVRELLADFNEMAPEATVHIYSNAGERVFTPRGGEEESPRDQPAYIRHLIHKEPFVAPPSGSEAIVLKNEPRCRDCHENGADRGVLTIGFNAAVGGNEGYRATREQIVGIVHAGFEQVMTGRQHEKLDAYFSELVEETPGLSGVSVYTTDEISYFGSDALELEEDEIIRALSPGAPFVVETDRGSIQMVPLENEPRCRGCHSDGEPMRGALAVAFGTTWGSETLVEFNNEERWAITQVAEYDQDYADFYNKEVWIPQEDGSVFVCRVASHLKKLATAREDHGGVDETDPLRGGCQDDPWFHIRPKEEEPSASKGESGNSGFALAGIWESDWDKDWEREILIDVPDLEVAFVQATVTSLQHVMLSGLGRMVKRYLNGVGAQGGLSILTVHDELGRFYHDGLQTSFSPPEHVAQAIEKREEHVQWRERGGLEEYVHVKLLENKPQCQSCHGEDHPLRGAIEVVLDASEAAETRKTMEQMSYALSAATLVLVIFLLYVGIRLTVIRPVRALGTVANAVGEGDLDVRVQVRSEDEMGRLGGTMNEMIVGLREKMEMSKFVSDGTVQTIRESDGVMSRSGVRKEVAILFSDIRGFTAFSETREPEDVVEMLNRYLQAQAEVVPRYGGDIDKFVGDELMVSFVGDDRAVRAMRCAMELLAVVEEVGRGDHGEASLQIGVGVNVGDVVMGAMGAEHRMDYTVIGDAVNLAARLCGAAAPGTVLVSQTIVDALPEVERMRLRALEPIQVKGKKDPIPVHVYEMSGAEPTSSNQA